MSWWSCSLPYAMRPESSRASLATLRCDRSVNVAGIIDVTPLVAAVEGVAIVRVERQVAAQSLDQIGVRREVPAEGDQIGVTAVNDRLRGIALEPPAAMIAPLKTRRN